MRYPSRLVVLFLCLFAFFAVTSPAWAQGISPTVYFSTGSMTSPSQIYSLDTSSGVATPISVPSGTDYEGLVVLPDNATGDTFPYVIYACDTAGDQIIRFNPGPYTDANPLVVQQIYSGGKLYPQCGRGTSKGDLIVTSTNPGKKGGWTEFAAVAYSPLANTSLNLHPSLLYMSTASTSIYEATAMKNIGDLLIVDKGGNQVLQSLGPISTQFSGGNSYTKIAPTPFITGLSGPMGIARATTGEVFVANQSSGIVTKFDAQGQNGVTCVSFSGNYTPYFMQMGLDNTLYIGATKNSKGEVLLIDANRGPNDCTVTNSFTPGVPVVGVALPPTSATATESSIPGGTGTCPAGAECFSFTLGDSLGGSAVLDVATGGSCTSTPYATATETSPFGPGGSGAISDLISKIPVSPGPYVPPENGLSNGGTPAVDLWADGFQIVFQAHFSGPAPTYPSCSPIGGTAGVYEETLSSFVDPGMVTSGTVAYCDTSLATGCDTVDLFGAYPYGGLLPQDYSGSGRTNSQFFVINATPFQTGQFCGYQSPLNGPTPPGIGGIFSTGSTISVKFKLATASGSCKNGPYIQTAQALISIAQLCTPGSGGADLICSPKGQVVLNPSNFVSLVPEGNSTQTPPEFKFGNNQYQFSLSLKGYPPGIYSLTTTFLSGETTDQTVLFQVQ